MTDQPNAPLTFRWYHALFNMKPYVVYLRNVELMEAHIHQLRAQAVKDNRELDRRAEQLDECRNHIAILTGAATEENTPYHVRGKHEGAQDRPKSAVRSGDVASDSNRRMREPAYATHVAESPTVTQHHDNNALLAVAAVMLMSEPETPAYVAPEPQREAYSPPSRNDSYDSSSSSDSSSPSSD